MERAQIKRFMKASFGNVIEWYDFSLFAYYTAAMGTVFFPHDDINHSIIGIFLIFGVGFVSRPVGGYLLGKIGDKYGRHYAVSLAVYGMSAASLLIAFLPGYRVFGKASVLLLLVLRLLQGMSAGGQFSGLLAIVTDMTTKRRAFLASVASAVSTLGFLLAVCVAYLIAVSAPPVLVGNEWRVAFVISGILGIVYYMTRDNEMTRQTPGGRAEALPKLLLPTIIRVQWRGFFGIVLLTFFSGGTYFFAYGYTYTYLTAVLGYGPESAYRIGIVMLCVGVAIYPVCGWLADRFGKQRVTMLGSLGLLTSVYFLVHGTTIYIVLLWCVLLVICQAAVSSGVLPISAEIFFQKWRMTASATAFNTGTAAAGFFPALCHHFVDAYGPTALVYFLTATALIGLAAGGMVRLSKGHKYIT